MLKRNPDLAVVWERGGEHHAVQVRIKKWGNSASVRIPAPIMRSASLRLNDCVEVREEDGRVVIEPVERPEVDLEQMIAAITPENRHEEVTFGPPAGKEKL